VCHAREAPTDADDTRSPAVPKLAFEVANRINEVMPITRISLVSLVLLGAEGRALSSAELRDGVGTYAAEVRRRGLPTTMDVPLDDPAVIDEALKQLAAHGIVRSTGEGGDATHAIAPDSLLAAAYYRNMVIHFFVDGAIAELAAAVMVAPGPPEVDPATTSGENRVEGLFEAARALRELLLFEFFFAGREEFDDEIAGELDDRLDDWRDRLDAGDAATVLDVFRPYRSPTILRPFVDAYRVVADLVEEDAFMGTLDEKQLVDRAMVLGRRYVTEGAIASGESVSKILFENAVKLARHRGLLEAAPDIVDRRQAFATQIRSLATRLAALSTEPATPDPAPQT
jgi:glycerol-3-phosphate O-acyltransferase